MLVYVKRYREDQPEEYQASLIASLNRLDVEIGINALRVDDPSNWVSRAAVQWAQQRHKEIRDHGRPQAVVIAGLPDCFKDKPAITTMKEFEEESVRVWKDAVRGQTKGLIERLQAMVETRRVIWIHDPDRTAHGTTGQ